VLSFSDAAWRGDASTRWDDDIFSLSFEIIVDLPSLSAEKAEALVAEAHAICAYSRAFSEGVPTIARAAQ
jgi:organic hydroperoxide reductase OsmC/OhrA